MFAIGELTLLCGIMLVAHPLFASEVLAILPGIKLFFVGLIMVIGGSTVRSMECEVRLLFLRRSHFHENLCVAVGDSLSVSRAHR